MKKGLLIGLVVLILAMAAACAPSAASSKNAAAVLKDNGDGMLSVLDTQGSPLDGGLNITVDKNEGFVNMQITDKNGEDTVEFYKFTPADSTCHRFRYVSMMGTGFHYFFDYKEGVIKKIEDKENADVTQSTKDSGRFEGAESETKEMVDKLIAYFTDTYGMSIEDAVN